jgi:ESCRT-I complex subunit TSG101
MFSVLFFSGYTGCPYPPGGQYPATTSSQYPSQPPVTAVGPSRGGTVSKDTIRASLISAVSDKLRWRMKEEIGCAQAELNALKRTEEDLKKGHQKLKEMVTQEVAEVDKNIELLRKNSVLLWRKWKINLKTMILMKLSFPQPHYTNRS